MNIQSSVSIFQQEGAVIVKGVLTPMEIAALRIELEMAMESDLDNRPNVFDSGMVHNCMFRGAEMLNILNNKIMYDYLVQYFDPNCILYAYQSSSLRPFVNSYASRIHVDSPRFIPGYLTNIGVILPLDNFTELNGATFYLKGSHRSEEPPKTDVFYKHSARLLCDAGDMIIFNARVYHAAGTNYEQHTRHALTLNFCRSYMRQRFDFPKMATQKCLDSLSDNGKQLLGMNVRMPISLE
jgi:ectoine hydroxylase-related dioxygenase (phytanoyl-CoA dioxygenase family)